MARARDDELVGTAPGSLVRTTTNIIQTDRAESLALNILSSTHSSLARGFDFPVLKLGSLTCVTFCHVIKSCIASFSRVQPGERKLEELGGE